MNRIYRLVFNRAIGIMQVASELASSAGGGGGGSTGRTTVVLRPVSFALWLALGWVGVVASGTAQQVPPASVPAGETAGRIVADPAAPRTQRPTVVAAPNGTPTVNITTPSAAGVSHNTYSQFDVGRQGAILNNARIDTQTQLGGWIQGNPWLATGTAKVILNEVNSANPSYLNGYVEVAGDRAEVIIANPAGIQVDGGGFINVGRTTLTTGKPVFNGGYLDSYRVSGGTIGISGAGLDASRSDYTQLIARSMQINAGIWARQLAVTAGANDVAVSGGTTKALASPTTTTGYAIDVGQLGGMYAGKITMIGTEHGVGVRNAGAIGAQAGDLVVTVDGRLENTGTLQARENTQVTAQDGVTNAGTLGAGRELVLHTAGELDNRGGTLNAMRVAVDAQSLRNRGGAIEQTGIQAFAVDAGALSNRDGGHLGVADSGGTGNAPGDGTAGTGSDTGNAGGGTNTGGGTNPGDGTQTPVTPLAEGTLRIAGLLDNDGGRIGAGGDLSVQVADGLDNSGGQLQARTLMVDAGSLDNRAGTLTVTEAARFTVDAFDNDGGRLNAQQALILQAHSLSNRGGSMQHAGTGATQWYVAGTLDNTDGTLASNAAALSLDAGHLVNAGGTLMHAGTDGLTITTGQLDGNGGTLVTAGALHLSAMDIAHRDATLSATQITLDATSLDNTGGQLVATGASANTLTLRGTLDNTQGLIVGNGDVALNAATLVNAHGTVQQAGSGLLAINAATVSGTAGTLLSNGHLTISGRRTDLTGGTTSAQRIAIDTGDLTTAGGQLIATGTEALQLHADGTLNNASGQIASNGALDVRAQALSNAGGEMTSASTEASTLTVTDTFDNTGGTLATDAAALRIDAGHLVNVRGTLSQSGADGLTITTGQLDGDGGTIVTAGALHLNATDIAHRDATLSAARISLDATSLDNTGSQLMATGHGDNTLTVRGMLDNTQGLIAGNGDVALNAATLVNTHGTVQQAGSGLLAINAATMNGTAGTLLSNGALTISGRSTDLAGGTTSAQRIAIDTGDLTTAGGQLVATGTDTLHLHADGTLNNDGGLIAGNGALDVRAQALSNVGGELTAAGTDDTAITVADRVDNRGGALVSNGALSMHAATLDNRNGRIEQAGAGGTLAITATTFNGAQGTLLSNGALRIDGRSTDLTDATTSAQRIAITTGDLTTAGGQLTATGIESLHLHADGRLNNDGGQIASNGALDVRAQTLSNRNGQLSAAGTEATSIAVTDTFDNTAGTLVTDAAALRIDAGHLVNAGGRLSQSGVDGLTISTGQLDGEGGTIVTAGALNLSATTIAHRDATLSAARITLDAESLYNTGGQIVATGHDANTLTLSGTLNNTQGLIAGNGDLSLRAATLSNAHGTVQQAGAGTLAIAAETLHGAAGTLLSNGALAIDGRNTDLTDATTSAQRIAITTGDLSTAGGQLTATGTESLLLHVDGTLNNDGGQIAGNGALDVRAQTLSNMAGQISVAGIGVSNVNLSGALNNQSGTLVTAGATALHAHDVDNRGGTLHLAGTQASRLDVAGTLDNRAGGMVAAAGALTLAMRVLDNQGGTLVAGGALDASASAGIDNRAGAIASSAAATLNSAGLDNAGGRVVGATLAIDTAEQALDNTAGMLAATTGMLRIDSGALDNRGGLLQAAGALVIDSHGQHLDNRDTGSSGGLLSGAGLRLASGALDNGNGLIHAQGDAVLDSATLGNTGGQVLAGGDATLVLPGTLDNHAGLIAAGQVLTVSAQRIDNTDTDAALGLQGATMRLSAEQIDNRVGHLAADVQLTINGTGNASTLDNAGGTVSSAGALETRIGRLVNTGGTLISGGDQRLVADALSGDGSVQSQGDLDIVLQQDFTNTGTVLANGRASLSTAGNLSNHGLLRAGALTVTATDIDNAAEGEISGNATTVIASGALHNRGLIDGVATRINAATLENLGSGRIYGDHLSIAAGSLLNREETLEGVTKAATIAARERLDIGVGSLLNREQALIFSAGSSSDALNIGGTLDAAGHAVGQAQQVRNASATIESLGWLSIATAQLRNSNEHFATREVVAVGPIAQTYLQPKGDPGKYDIGNFVWESWSHAGRYRWKDDPPPSVDTELGRTPIPRVGEQTCSGEGDDTCTRLPGADYPANDPAWVYFGVPAPAAEPQAADYADSAAFEAAHAAWLSQTDERYTALDEHIDAYNNGFASSDIRDWTQYEVTRTEYTTEVTASAPALIRAGGDLHLHGGDLVNDKSRIIVGGTLSGDLGNLQNLDATGTYRIHEVGTSQFTYSRWRGGFKRYHERKWDGKQSYRPADQETTINLGVMAVKEHTGSGTGMTIAALGGGTATTATGRMVDAGAPVLHATGGTAGDVDGATVAQGRQADAALGAMATGGDQAQAGPGTGAQHVSATGAAQAQASSTADAASADGQSAANAQGQTGGPVRTTPINTTVPSASLFQPAPGNAGYLVETDPRFTHYRQWLGSDYLLGLLGSDPALTQKRLGDGYYEQQLIRDQVAELTGRRFLQGYASDEAQYRALMEAGASFAQQLGLRPGVALSAAQMAQLTSDIVWLVERTVTLADGSTATALVPQLYVRTQPGDLDGSGSLIAAQAIDLHLSGDLLNGGTIAGRSVVNLSAQNLRNLGGTITGDTVALHAREDLDNIGGTVSAQDALLVQAGHDLNVATTTHSGANAVGASDFSRTQIDRVAGLYVTGANATLIASAGHDLGLTAAQVRNAGSGPTVLAAGHDLSLNTVQTAVQENTVADAHNALRTGHREEVGSTLNTQGALSLQAGHDLTARAATLQSESGAIILSAGNDVILSAGQATASLDESHRQTHSGTFGSTTKTTRDSVQETWAQGSTVSGNTVAISGQNITVTGSTVISDAGTTLLAQEAITVEAAQNTRTETHVAQTKRSGLFTGGEVGFTIGTQQIGNKADITEITHTGSVIGSVDGRVDIVAGGHYQQTGSDVIGDAGVAISGATVTIEHAQDSHDVHETQTAKSGGLHISIKGGAADAAASAYGSLKRADEVGDDRLKTLYAMKAVQGLYGGGSNPLGNIGGQVDNAKAVVKGDQQANGGGMSLRIGLGASSSKAENSYHEGSAHGSTVSSGHGDTTIVAREGDLSIIGSSVDGVNTTVAAQGNLNLLSAEEASRREEKSKSQSGEIGVTIGSEAGIGVYVSAAMAQGKGHGEGSTHAETLVRSQNTTTFASGGNTTLQGAQLIGESVIGQVGGNFTLTSEQDSNDYKRKDQSAGIDVAIGTGGGSVSGNYSQSKINSTYTSVKEQTGIQAGNGGFDITVGGHTQLTGAALASMADPSKNYFSTGSLGWSDLKNEAEYKASSVSVSGGGGSGGGSFSASVAPPQHEKASSTTKAGIADGSLIVHDGSGEGIARGTSALQQDGLKTIFDQQKVQENMELGMVAGEVATTAVDDYSNAKLAKKQEEIDKYLDAADKLTQEGDKAGASKLYETANHLRTERDDGYGMTISKTLAAFGISALTGNISVDSVLTYAGTTGGIAFWDEAANKAMRGHDETSAIQFTCYKTAQECADLYKNMPADGADVIERIDYLRKNGMEVNFIDEIPQGATNITVNGILNDEARAGHVEIGHVSMLNKDATDVTYYVQYNATKGAFSDLLQAGYDKFVSPFNGDYSATTLAVVDAVTRQGNVEVRLAAHSWGSIVTRNILNILDDNDYRNSALYVAVFGPAVRAGALVKPMVDIVGYENLFPSADLNDGIKPHLVFLSSPNDPVSGWVGGNIFPSKYTNNNSPEYLPGAARTNVFGSLWGFVPVYFGPENPHSCYGLNCLSTKFNWTIKKAAEWNKAPAKKLKVNP